MQDEAVRELVRAATEARKWFWTNRTVVTTGSERRLCIIYDNLVAALRRVEDTTDEPSDH